MSSFSRLEQSILAENEEIIVEDELHTEATSPILPDNLEDQYQSESSYDSSSSVDEGDSYGEDRKRRRNQNYVLIVPRSDIRRTYPQMLVNVLNSQSVPLIYSFFVTYSCHNLVGIHQFSSCILQKNIHDSARPTATPDCSPTTTLRGPLQMVMYFAILQQIIPDQIVILRSGKIRTSSVRSTTHVECEMQLDFTLLYKEVNPMAIADHVLHFVDQQSGDECIYKASLDFGSLASPPPTFSNATSLGAKKCRKKMSIQKTNVIDISDTFHVPNTLKYYSEVMYKCLSLEKSPKKISLSFSLTMIIDSIRRIQQIEMKDPRII